MKHEHVKESKHDSKSKGTPKIVHFENLSEVPVSDILL